MKVVVSNKPLLHPQCDIVMHDICMQQVCWFTASPGTRMLFTYALVLRDLNICCHI